VKAKIFDRYFVEGGWPESVKMQVGEGDRVRKGQLLAEIENLDGRAQLEKALAGLPRSTRGAGGVCNRSLKAAIAAEGRQRPIGDRQMPL
jgi:multidrug efflux pump subunit AcrA (membrane-fusion protein)